MIDYSAVRVAIEKLLIDNFTLLPIALENTLLNDDISEFIDVTTQDNAPSQAGIGEDVYEVSGYLIISIYSIRGSGTEKARKVASEIVNIFDNNEVPGIDFTNPEFTSIGYVKDEPLYQHNLTMVYNYFYGQQDQDC